MMHESVGAGARLDSLIDCIFADVLFCGLSSLQTSMRTRTLDNRDLIYERWNCSRGLPRADHIRTPQPRIVTEAKSSRLSHKDLHP